MPVARPRLALAPALAVALACAASDESTSRTGSGAFTSASASGGATTDATSGATDDATTGATTTTDAATTTDASAATGDATSTTTGAGGSESDGDATSTTGEPAASCWSASPVDWVVAPLDRAKLVGASATDLMISADGLTLYYVAGPEDERRPYRTVRGGLADPFEGGTIEAIWADLTENVGYARASAERKEMIVSVAGDVRVSIHDGQGWGTPVAIPDPVSTAAAETVTSITEDGARLILQRDDGPDNPVLGATWRFHELSRPPDAAAGTPFAAHAVAALPGITDDDYPHVNLCPTISPDGLHLFFGSTYPEVLTMDNLGDALDVYVADRKDLGAPWETPIAIPSLHEPGLETCPSTVTADGCTLIFHRFKLGGGQYDVYVATRTPE